LIKHSGMDAHALRNVWIKTMHLGTPWVVELPIAV
jgi:hypothetical protein